jgi:hypothetical protein
MNLVKDKALTFARRLTVLEPDVSIRKFAALRELEKCAAQEAAELVDALITLSREGSEEAATALKTLLGAFEEPDGRIDARRLSSSAHAIPLARVAALFVTAAPRRVYDARQAAKADAQAFSETLGHQKQMARVETNRDVIIKLLQSSHPHVVRNVLINPRVTQPLVLQAAARRPVRSEPLVEIWRSRWGVDPGIRRALAFNPYLPVEVGAKIVPLLSKRDLIELSLDGGVHAALREQAQLLLRDAS